MTSRVDGVGVDASIPTLLSRGVRSAARRPAALKICHQALFCKLCALSQLPKLSIQHGLQRRLLVRRVCGCPASLQ